MPEPLEFRIAQQIRDTLKAIATSAGYYYTLQGTASKLDPDVNVEALELPAGPRPFAITELPWDGRESLEYESAGQMVITWPFTIDVVNTVDLTDDEDRVRVHTRNCADVEKAFASNLTLGGLISEGSLTILRRVLVGITGGAGGAEVWSRLFCQLVFERTFGQA